MTDCERGGRTCRPGRERVFYGICLLHAFLVMGPLRGITIWYDEAWRMLVAVGSSSWSHFFGRWFAHDLPIPISLPYLLWIRLVHGSLGLPASEYVLRLANLFASFIVIHELWVLTARWTGSRIIGISAALLLATNPYFGYYVFSIKEHVVLVALLALWTRRIQRLVATDRPTGPADLMIAWSLTFFSPLAVSGIGAVTGWLLAAKFFGRSRRHDILFVVCGVLPVVFWTLAQLRCVNLLELDFEQFCRDYGLEQLPPGSLYGSEKTSFADLPLRLLYLGGAPTEYLALLLPAGAVWFMCLALSLLKAMQERSRFHFVLLAITLFPPATLLFFQVATGVAAPRMVLWLAPLMAASASAVFLSGAPRARMAGYLFLGVLLATTSAGWIRWWKIYPAKKDYPSFISTLGPLRHDRGNDVVLHTQGLLYYPHAVLDPSAKKAIFPLPEEGTAMMTLHPACPVLGGFPVDPVWTDSDLRGFHGNAAWAVTNYAFSPGLASHMEQNLFGGDNRTDTFIDWPYYWTRVGRK